MSLDISLTALRPTNLLDANFTHNVTPMWREAGVYDALYMSDGKQAGEYVQALEAGLTDMKANPEKYEALDSPNGWGTYAHALPWLEKVTAAFRDNPDAVIGVWK